MSAIDIPRRVHGLLGEVGELFVIALEAVRRTWDVRTWAWEFAEQAWFLARVTSLPVILVSLPLGATVALQVGQLAAQLGAAVRDRRRRRRRAWCARSPRSPRR